MAETGQLPKREFSAIAAAGKNGKLISSRILRGKEMRVDGHLHGINGLELDFKQILSGNLKDFLLGSHRIGIHSHPMGSYSPGSFFAAPSWPDFCLLFHQSDSAAILDFFPDPQSKKPTVRVSLYLKGKDAVHSSFLPMINPNQRKWGASLQELSSYRTSLAAVLDANGIKYYEALRDEESKQTGKLKFKTVRAADLNELGPFIKSRDIGLFLPSGMVEIGNAVAVNFRRRTPEPSWGLSLPSAVAERIYKESKAA